MKLEKLQKLVKDSIDKEIFSAISIKVSGTKEFDFSAGYLDLSKTQQVNKDSLFDLASITKTVIAMKFYQLFYQNRLNPNKLNPNDTILNIYAYLGVNIDVDLGHKNLSDLLSHSSGLKAWLPLYDTLNSKQEYYKYLKTQYPKAKSQVEYSDLGYILLGEILELHYQTPLLLIIEDFINEIGIDPKELLYLPLENKNINTDNIVSSGQSNIRQNIQGVVNDDNAFAMGGVSGHAGLFGTIGALSKFGDLVLKTYKKGSRISDSKSFKSLIAQKDTETGWSAGWVYPTPGGQAGSFISKNSIGSLGFTGTSLWIDLDKEFTISILANRTISKGAITHSSMLDEFKIIRPKIMDIVLSNL